MKDGGSINIKGGSCIQYQVCSINSTIPSNNELGSHSYVASEDKNYVIFSTIFLCKGYSSSIYLGNGDQMIQSTNISYSESFQAAAYFCKNPSNHIVNLSLIYNNTAEQNSIMYHEDSNHTVHFCSIIQNSCPNSGGILASLNAHEFEVDFLEFNLNAESHTIYFKNISLMKLGAIKGLRSSVFSGRFHIIGTKSHFSSFNLTLYTSQKCNLELPFFIYKQQFSEEPHPYQNSIQWFKRKIMD